MKKLLIVIPIFLILINSAFAQDIFSGYQQSVSDFASNVLGIPQEWLTLNSLIFNVLIPFLAIMAVCFGMLRQIKIFPRAPQIELLLSFLMAFSTLPTKAFVAFVSVSLGAMGMWAYILFFLLFIIGSTLFAVARGRGYVAEAQASFNAYSSIEERMKRIRDRRSELASMLAKNPDQYAKQMEKLDQEEQKLRAALRAWRDHN